MKKVRRHISIFLLVISLLGLAVPTAALGAGLRSGTLFSLGEAYELPEAPLLQSDYAILIEAKSGAILYEKNAYETAYPASITKIMTGLLAAESLNLDQDMTFSYRATHELEAGSSTIARTENEVMTVRDTLYGLLVASANECAQALAEEVSGSFEAFAARMTLRAYELGCVNTNFSNPSGLQDTQHYTCPHDMALIMQAAMKNDTLREIMSTTAYQIAPTNKHDEITYLASHHPLLTNTAECKYQYAIAGKTGYTSDAMNTLVTYAEKGDLGLICVVMHADGTKATGQDSRALFEYGFANFACLNAAADFMKRSAAEGSAAFLAGNILNFSSGEASFITLPKGHTLSELSVETVYGNDGSDAQVVATQIYRLGDTVVGKIPLSLEPVEKHTPLEAEIFSVPTAREKLRTEYLGLALIYWILIGGGLLLLVIITLAVLITVKLIRRAKHRRLLAEHNRRHRFSDPEEDALD